MSPLAEREEAQALKESDLVPSEPITAVLSKAGWIRAAKGHEVDATGMSYRSGDGYQAHVRGKSNEKIYVLDSTGRSYSIDAHNLASARGQGDPLTSVLKPPAGATFEQLLTGNSDQRLILASSQGYGFINTLGNLDSNQKAGKNIITLAAGSRLLPAARINNQTDINSPTENASSTIDNHIPDHIAVVTNAGYLLMFALSDLPEQARGKGNKMITLKDKEDVLAITLLRQQDSLIITAGKRHVTLKPMDLANYTAKRGSRGGQLPRGFQNVTSVEVA